LDLFAVDYHVQLSMLQIELRGLEIIRQLLANRLFDDDPAREAEYRSRLGDNNISEHGKTSRYAPGGRVRNDRNIESALFMQPGQGSGCLRHLHQAENALLHAGTAGSREDDQRETLTGGGLNRPGNLLADNGAHAACKEIKAHDGYDSG